MVKQLQKLKENFGTQSIGPRVILKAMTTFVRQLEKKLCSLQDETGLLLKTNKEFMRRYSEQKTVV